MGEFRVAHPIALQVFVGLVPLEREAFFIFWQYTTFIRKKSVQGRPLQLLGMDVPLLLGLENSFIRVRSVLLVGPNTKCIRATR